MEIIPYRSEYKSAFIRLNLAWLNRYFHVEERDEEMLQGVEEFIEKGAAVYLALEGKMPVAVCMVIPRGCGVWEICKLAAHEGYRRRGAGSAVLSACIRRATEQGAKKFAIASNTRLTAAMRLYEKFGFVRVPLTEEYMEYARKRLS